MSLANRILHFNLYERAHTVLTCLSTNQYMKTHNISLALQHLRCANTKPIVRDFLALKVFPVTIYMGITNTSIKGLDDWLVFNNIA